MAAVHEMPDLEAGTGRRVLADERPGPAILASWRAGLIRTTFQASPRRSIARITRPPMSISRRRRPWKAEVGKAW